MQEVNIKICCQIRFSFVFVIFSFKQKERKSDYIILVQEKNRIELSSLLTPEIFDDIQRGLDDWKKKKNLRLEVLEENLPLLINLNRELVNGLRDLIFKIRLRFKSKAAQDKVPK